MRVRALTQRNQFKEKGRKIKTELKGSLRTWANWKIKRIPFWTRIRWNFKIERNWELRLTKWSNWAIKRQTRPDHQRRENAWREILFVANSRWAVDRRIKEDEENSKHDEKVVWNKSWKG